MSIATLYAEVAKRIFDPEHSKKSVSQLNQILLFSVIIAALSFAQDFVNPILSYKRDSVLNGEWWRIWTCNLVHLSVNHMLLNLSMLILLTLLVRNTISNIAWYGSLCICFSAVGFGLLAFDDHVIGYVGMSGALYGLVVFSLLINLKESPWLYSAVLLYVYFKVIWQQMSGQGEENIREFIGGAVIVTAHLYGLIAGSAVALAILYSRHLKTVRSRSETNK